MADYLSNKVGRISPDKTSADSNLHSRKNLSGAIRPTRRHKRKGKRG